MAYPPTPRDDFFAALAAEILHNYARGRVLVAVDAIVGGRRFADDLAVALREAGHPVFRASLDDFQRPRIARVQRGAHSPEALYLDWYDYSAFLRVLVEPFRMGGSTGFITATFDADRDIAREARWVTAPQDAILLIDGPFLQRPELRGIANFVAYLEAPAAESDAQTASANRLYEAAVGPRTLADAIVGVSEAGTTGTGTSGTGTTDTGASGTGISDGTPKRLFADRC